MQCPRCSYIRFRSSPQCLNCGFDFKNRKSSSDAVWESENVFTIFTSNDGQDVTASNAATSETKFPAPSTHERVDPEMAGSEGYDSLLEQLESSLQDSGDFELDLSEMDNPDSEDWVIGATLIEDHAKISRIAPQDSSKNPGQQTNDLEYQGLGFDTIGDVEYKEIAVPHQEKSSSFDTEPLVLSEERALPEMEPYARLNATELEWKEDESPQIKDENIPKPLAGVGEKGHEADHELTNSSTNDSNRDQIFEMQDSQEESEEIDLETDLEFMKKYAESGLNREIANISENSESSIDSKDNPIDPEPTLELEDLHLDLETKSPDIESPKDNSL